MSRSLAVSIVVLVALLAGAGLWALSADDDAGVPASVRGLEPVQSAEPVAARLLAEPASHLPLSARMAVAEAQREARAAELARAALATVDDLRAQAEGFANAEGLDPAGRTELARLVDAADRELLRLVRVVELGGAQQADLGARFAEARRRFVIGAEAAWPDRVDAIRQHFADDAVPPAPAEPATP